MTLILDAGPLVASADVRDPRRLAVQNVLREETRKAIIPAPVTAEVDYLLGRRLGSPARRGLLDDLAAGRFDVRCIEPHDYALVSALEQRYSGLEPGLADLSIVALAFRFQTRRIVTFDERHFRAIAPLQGGAFTLLPADA